MEKLTQKFPNSIFVGDSLRVSRISEDTQTVCFNDQRSVRSKRLNYFLYCAF